MLKRAAALAGLVAVTVGLGSAQAGPGSGDYIVVLKGGTDSIAIAAKHKQKYGADLSHVYKHALKGYAATLSAQAKTALDADPGVLFVAPDREFHATAACPAQNFEILATQCMPRGIDRIDADLSSTASGDGGGDVDVNVAVLDTGVDLDHPDLNHAGGTDCTNAGTSDDNHGHGTHVAGTAAARDNGSGVVGVAPGASVFGVKVLRKNGAGSMSQIICGIDWVTSTRTDSAPSNDISVANMSLGAKGSDDGNCGATNRDPYHAAICNSVEAGVTYVVSAGNDGTDLSSQVPAAYDEVLTVTALLDWDGAQGGTGTNPAAGCSLPEPDDSPAPFSNFATLPADQDHTIAAPGVCIFSTFPNGVKKATPHTYVYLSGTSMSAPHVTGTVALCIASGPCAGLTPPQIVQKMVADAAAYNTANPGYGFQGDPLRPMSGKYYGYLIRAAQY
jgi:subtilisin